MKREIEKLTKSDVASAKEPGLYSDGGGLYLQLAKIGGKSWIFKYKILGREREMGLGPVHTITLAMAREQAERCRLQRYQGLDPIKEREKDRQARLGPMTFKAAAEGYFRAHITSRHSLKYRDNWQNSLRDHVHPVIGVMSVAAITTDDLLRVLNPIWTTKAATAGQVRDRIESVLEWAKTLGYRSGENPARWLGHLEHRLPRPGKPR
jgi:Arm DNA-binding domain